MSDWVPLIGWDYRFNAIVLRISNHKENQDFMFPLTELIRHSKMPKHELLAAIEQATEPAVSYRPIEIIREKAIRQADIKGKTVLDLGGYDGQMAKLALECGASNAVVVDSEQWRIYGWKQPDPIPGVKFVKSELLDWEIPFDVVIFYNCLYHVRDPMLTLTHVRSLTKETMLLCTLHRYHDGAWMYVYNPRECNPEDPSVYFGPSIPALERMLTLTGWQFNQLGIALDRVVYTCRPIPGFVDPESVEVRRVNCIEVP